MGLIAELRRRNVFRMAGLYLVGAWLLVQVAGTVLPMFGAPAWLPRSIVIVLALGFIPALVFAWVFEMTPEGFKRDSEIAPEQSIAPQTAQRMNRTIFVVMLLALGYFGFDKFVLAPSRQASEVKAAEKQGRNDALAEDTDKSIAVLPFVDMSQQHDQEYFSDGIAEELLNRLAQIPDLRVAARTSAFQFKGKNLDVAEIGRKLKVTHVLEGSVRKDGTRLRITAQLINSVSGYHLWSQTFEGDVGEVFKLQDQISTAITDALQTKLSLRSAGSRKDVVVDPQAYDDYLQGRAFTAKRVDENLKLAVAAFDRAIARDPSYAAAHSGRAFAMALSANWRAWLPSTEIVAQTRASANRALELDPNNAEAMISRGFVAMYNWDIAGARANFEHAYALAPDNVDVLNFYGDFQRLLGNLRDAERLKRKAMGLDPLAFIHPDDLSVLLMEQGRYTEALDMARRADSLGSPNARYTAISALRALKKFDEAGQELAKQCPADSRFGNCIIQTIAQLSATGRRPEAKDYVEKIIASNKVPRPPENGAVRAAVYSNYLADIPAATRDLRLGLEKGNSWSILQPLRANGALRLPEEISQDPQWLAVWSDPKLHDLMTAYRANLIAFRKGD